MEGMGELREIQLSPLEASCAVGFRALVGVEAREDNTLRALVGVEAREDNTLR